MVEIIITVVSPKEKKTQDRLDNIEIDIKESAEKTSFKTKINSNSQNINGKNSLDISYEVKMPKSNSLKLKNSFGASSLTDLNGKADLEIDFGSATIGKLSHPESILLAEFSKPVQVAYMEGGEVTAKYSTVLLAASRSLKIESEFSEIEIEVIEKLDMVFKFGSAKVMQVDEVSMKSNMSSIEIENLMKSGEFRPKYGKLTIDKVSKDMTSLVINGEFSPIRVKIEKGASFTADISSSMAGITVPSEGWREHDKSTNSESYQGSFGQAGENLLKVRSSFGSVNIDF